MEEINFIGNINSQSLSENTVNVRASEIIKIFSSPENRHSFAIENSKFDLFNFRFIYP